MTVKAMRISFLEKYHKYLIIANFIIKQCGYFCYCWGAESVLVMQQGVTPYADSQAGAWERVKIVSLSCTAGVKFGLDLTWIGSLLSLFCTVLFSA